MPIIVSYLGAEYAESDWLASRQGATSQAARNQRTREVGFAYCNHNPAAILADLLAAGQCSDVLDMHLV